MSKIKIPEDAEALSLLSVKFSLTSQIEQAIRTRLHTAGHLVELPGSFDPLVSKARFIEAVERFLNEVPQAKAALDSNARLRAHYDRQVRR